MIKTPSLCSIRCGMCGGDAAATSDCLLVGHVQLVHGVEFELDLFPGLHRDLELGAVLRGGSASLFAFAFLPSALGAALDAGFERDAVGRGAGRVAPGMAQSAAAELQHGVVTEDGGERRHVPHVDTAGGDGQHAGHGAPVLIEEDAALAVFLDEAVTHDVDPAQSRLAVAFEFADHGAATMACCCTSTVRCTRC